MLLTVIPIFQFWNHKLGRYRYGLPLSAGLKKVDLGISYVWMFRKRQRKEDIQSNLLMQSPVLSSHLS